MSRGVKIALIIVGSLFVLAATCAGGAYYWWSQNGEGFVEGARTAMDEGADFGRQQPGPDACIDAGLERTGQCGQMQISCVTNAQMFTQACLGTAPADPNLCQDVPPPDAVMDSVKFTTSKCRERGQANNQFCSNVFSALQTHCANPR